MQCQWLGMMISKGKICKGIQDFRDSKFNNPTSMQNSPVSGSLATVAVNPAAEEDFPDVYTDLGTIPEAYL